MALFPLGNSCRYFVPLKVFLPYSGHIHPQEFASSFLIDLTLACFGLNVIPISQLSSLNFVWMSNSSSRGDLLMLVSFGMDHY